MKHFHLNIVTQEKISTEDGSVIACQLSNNLNPVEVPFD